MFLAFIVKLKMMKAAKANKKAHKKTEADKKSSTSSISDGDADHKAGSREAKIKGTYRLILQEGSNSACS